MSIEESRQRRAERQAQAKKQQQQPTAQAKEQPQDQAKAPLDQALREAMNVSVMDAIADLEARHHQPPLDLEAIRQVVREVVAAELRPIKVELQTIGHVLAILSQAQETQDQESATSQRPQWPEDDSEDGDQEGETQEEQERGDEAAQTWDVLPARAGGQQRHREGYQEPEPIMILEVQRPGQRRQDREVKQ